MAFDPALHGLRDVREEWSVDGLTLTIFATLPDGREAEGSVTWTTAAAAEENAATAREDMLGHLARYAEGGEDALTADFSEYRKAKRRGPLFVVTGRLPQWRWVPEFAVPSLKRHRIGIRWGRHFVIVSTAAYVKTRIDREAP